jgi:hypothetical protein
MTLGPSQVPASGNGVLFGEHPSPQQVINPHIKGRRSARQPRVTHPRFLMEMISRARGRWFPGNVHLWPKDGFVRIEPALP